MGLYKFKLEPDDDRQISTLGLGFNKVKGNPETGSKTEPECYYNDKFNNYVRDHLGLDNIYADLETQRLIINDKIFEVSLYNLAYCWVFLCDSYDYEFCMFLPQSEHYFYQSGGDNYSAWVTGGNVGNNYYGYPLLSENNSVSFRGFCLCYLEQDKKHGIPRVLGGALDPVISDNNNLGYSYRWFDFCNGPIGLMNGGAGKVNKFKDGDTSIKLAKFFCHKTGTFFEIVSPMHLYISQNLTDSGFKSIVKDSNRSFINVGNIFYMPYDDIILNETTWKGDAKPE